MQHLGDVTKINGAEVPIVDCVIGGSPCQDLSIAGKRDGLAGERSGLFMEQIRIIKEMRERDGADGRTGVSIRPRYMVWENVPGAFSSSEGADFATVLEETIKIAEPTPPPVQVPEKGWPTSGCYFDMGGRWSVAWRVLDAQFWGVPQRRRRIALVADFGGMSAPEILFERESVSRNLEPCVPARKGLAEGIANCAGATGFDGYNGDLTGDVSTTLGVNCGMSTGRNGILLNDQGGSVMSVSEDVAATIRAQERGYQPCVLDMTHANDVIRECGETVPTLQSRMGTGGNQVPLAYRQRGFGDYQADEVGSTCKQRDSKGATDLVVAAVDCRNGTENPNVNGTLQAKESGGYSVNLQNTVRVNERARRLTPLECERLQGFPDGWTDIGSWVDSKGKKRETSDTARYKALGNSIALPPWKWVLKRLCGQYERQATMASLFDGIGGFPLIWEQINGEGSCLWVSEIEEFPMSVTKSRFTRIKNDENRDFGSCGSGG